MAFGIMPQKGGQKQNNDSVSNTKYYWLSVCSGSRPINLARLVIIMIL